jgi:hypothetical protein
LAWGFTGRAKIAWGKFRPAFDQALDYFSGIPDKELPKVVIVCDFARFRLHRTDGLQLVKAHQALDKAVDKAYESNGGKKAYANDAERVAFLFTLYQQYTSLLPQTVQKKSQKRERQSKKVVKTEGLT